MREEGKVIEHEGKREGNCTDTQKSVQENKKNCNRQKRKHNREQEGKCTRGERQVYRRSRGNM